MGNGDMKVSELLERCRELGATLTTVDDRVKVKAPEPLPDDVIAALKQAKPQVLAELRRQSYECWVLEEWRKTSIPSWRGILSESIEKRDKKREVYARWMLREMLEDPDYTE